MLGLDGRGPGDVRHRVRSAAAAAVGVSPPRPTGCSDQSIVDCDQPRRAAALCRHRERRPSRSGCAARTCTPIANDAAAIVADVLAANPFTTLQVVLEPTASPRADHAAAPRSRSRGPVSQRPTYLDKFYAVLPGPDARGAKRLIVLLPHAHLSSLGPTWIDSIGQFATLVCRGAADESALLNAHELSMV